MHLPSPASVLSCILPLLICPVLHPSSPESYCPADTLSCIYPVQPTPVLVHHLLFCLPPFLPTLYPAFLMSTKLYIRSCLPPFLPTSCPVLCLVQLSPVLNPPNCHVLHSTCPASVLSCTWTCPVYILFCMSWTASFLFFIWPVLHLSCRTSNATDLFCIRPVLHLIWPALHLYCPAYVMLMPCIGSVLHPSFMHLSCLQDNIPTVFMVENSNVQLNWLSML